ncbi:MAG: inner membrane protein [Candidatus Endobugula sp.]|jgi:inner membrane protein
MDPLTQGMLGVVAAQSFAKPKVLLTASLLGLLSGMAPDIDIIIRSTTDPLLALEFHRQFTHSLFFIPFGGFICALVFSIVFRPLIRRAELSFLQTLLYCTLGYASHGLLDACTTYGTQLLWPFSNARVAWNTISIIDPLYTLPLLLFIILTVVYRSRRLAMASLAWIVIYTSVGIVQRERAEAFGLQLALDRGHQPISLEAKPSFANLLVWKIVYTTESHFYVDAIRAGWQAKYYQGDSVRKLNVGQDFPWLDAESQQAKDIERFRWFSNGYIAISPYHPQRIIDIRFSLLPNEIRGLWGIELDQSLGKQAHIHYVADRSREGNTFTQLWKMIVGAE